MQNEETLVRSYFSKHLTLANRAKSKHKLFPNNLRYFRLSAEHLLYIDVLLVKRWWNEVGTIGYCSTIVV